MVGVLKSNNLIILYAKHFLFFEWTLEESDLRPNTTLRSSEFNMEDEKTSYLEFKTDNKGTSYLYLHYPKCVENGRYVLSIFDKDYSSIDARADSINPIIASMPFDLIPDILKANWAKFPIMISCVANALNSSLFEESNDTHERRMRELRSDFKTILDQELNTDIVFKVDEEIIKTHKLILEARSPVFRRMFSPESSEAAENTVVIPDIKPSTMKKLVSFLYTAEMEKCDFDEILELYYAADKYEVLSLRAECRTELLNNLAVNNACTLFTLASRHNDEDLKEKVVQFVSANFKSVVNVNNLSEISKDDIMLLMSLCAPNIDEFYQKYTHSKSQN